MNGKFPLSQKEIEDLIRREVERKTAVRREVERKTAASHGKVVAIHFNYTPYKESSLYNSMDDPSNITAEFQSLLENNMQNLTQKDLNILVMALTQLLFSESTPHESFTREEWADMGKLLVKATSALEKR